VEVYNHVPIDLTNVVDITEDRLTHHVLSEHIEV